MTSSTTSWRKHLTKQRIVLAVIFVCVVTAAPSLIKWCVYELDNAAPRLRSMIGTEVEIPQQTFRVVGKDVSTGPHTGTLTYVGYRWNDDWAWFDLEVHEEGENSMVHTGLSPSEARSVTVLANKP